MDEPNVCQFDNSGPPINKEKQHHEQTNQCEQNGQNDHKDSPQIVVDLCVLWNDDYNYTNVMEYWKVAHPCRSSKRGRLRIKTHRKCSKSRPELVSPHLQPFESLL